MKSYYAVALFTVLAATSLRAATVDQVGMYVGTATVTTQFSNSKTKEKVLMSVAIANDNTTTVTLNGTMQLSQGAGYGPQEGIIIWVDPVLGAGDSATLCTTHFKNGKLSGSFSSVFLDTSGPTDVLIKTQAGKYKLTKVNP